MDCSGAAAPAAPAAPAPKQEITTLVGPAEDRWPVPARVWDVFQSKGIRTSFLSIGAGPSALTDLELAESLGCPIHIVPLTEAESASWAEVSAILKERKREGANATNSFSVGAEAKWVLPKNIRPQAALPWWGKGRIEMGSASIDTMSVESVIAPICAGLKLKDNAQRIDILKLDTVSTAPGLEKGVLGAVLSSGYRPALVMVRWSERPDFSLSACTAAGHLQSCGYRLLAKEGDKFLYYFTDDDMYQICSWENVEVRNPMVQELVATAKATFSSPPEEGVSQASQ